ncbi:MAG: sigma-54-dependent Fis family transcriptional regulator [Acidobacteria bacterium]|nr:sigma-54-dependent Fis family transcriptional regulator [Acidobacteriota bacterium]MBI3656670.1 sigma-54-dependent Fis family transcriptional regulator [Acidobacteriota bacterium]
MGKETILVVDDERLLRWSLKQKLMSWGYRVIEAEDGATTLSRIVIDTPDLITLDIRLPDTSGIALLSELKSKNPNIPIIMITAYGTIDDAVRCLKTGAYDFIEKPINFDKLQNLVKNALETSRLRSAMHSNVQYVKTRFGFENIIGNSSLMTNAVDLVRKVTLSEATTVLIQGETGTGKDLIARAMHYESRRDAEPFLTINCAAIPETLIETELFGHEKGAFTDARILKKGIFELADRGSVFLDEISEMQLNMQSKLLRVLEDQTFRRVGGTKDLSVDVRIVAASNRNLEEWVAAGKFRADLYYRLAVITIHLPTLRERAGDIPPLITHFIKHYNAKFKKNIHGVTRSAEKLLTEYPWPGNVRELKNVIERAMILQDQEYIDAEHLPIRIAEPQLSPLFLARPSGADASLGGAKTGLSLFDIEKQLIEQALNTAGGNKTKAAKLLGISRDTLRYRVKKYGLNSLQSK